MKYFLVTDQDGANFVQWAGDGLPPSPDGFPAPIELDRMPEPYETYDRETGEFVRNDAKRIDDEYTAANGREAIARAHALKSIEAGLILNGVTIEGLLSAEAAATGHDLNDLAQIVAAKAAAMREAEVARIVAKRGG